LTLAIEAPRTSLDFSLTGRHRSIPPSSTNRLTDLAIDSVLTAELPLAALNAFPQLVDHVFGGRVRVATTYGGRLGDFMPTGTLHVVDGEYAHIAGISLTKIEAEVQLDRGQATLVQARGYNGSRASCTITGGVQWATAPDQGVSTQLGVSLDRLPFANEGIRMLISGETTVRGEAGTFEIASDLALDEAALDLDESLARAKAQRPTHSTSKTSSAGDLLKELDVTIRAATPIKVVGLGLDSEWYGEMGMRKEEGKVVFTGGFKPRRGTYTVFTRPFRIESGEIRLGGTGSLTPVLDIKSEYSRGEVTVTARLHGDANALELDFSSIPSMPQDEMLSWVLFGNDSSALTPLQGLKLAQVAAQLVGGPANLGKRKKAAETLNVDRVELREMSNQTSSTSLVVGKQVSERVYMEFIHEVGGQAASNIFVEYELTPHFTVETTIGSRANTGVGANYTFDY
jgi:translocation and assembly module TamB